MKLKRARRNRAPRLELLDALMDSYLQWRDESRAVTETYRKWNSAAASDRDVAFGKYLTALSREEDAACDYRRVVEWTRGHSWPALLPAAEKTTRPATSV